MKDTAEITAARAEIDRTRARLMDTAHELQERLSPKVLAKGAWQGAKEKGADLAEDAVDAVRARPLATTGVVAALTMFLAREPLIDLAGRLASGVGEKRKSRKARKAEPNQPERTDDRPRKRTNRSAGIVARARNPRV